MADYIDRDKVLDAVFELPHKMDEQGYGWIARVYLYHFLCDFPAADVQPVKWIPVTERLPKEVGWYLVVVLAPFKQVRMYEFYPVHNNYGNDLWRNNDGDHVSNWFVTHWMPLPKPPKDGEA